MLSKSYSARRTERTPAATAPARTVSTTKPKPGSSARRNCWCRPPISCSPSRCRPNCAAWPGAISGWPVPGTPLPPSAATTPSSAPRPARWACCTPTAAGWGSIRTCMLMPAAALDAGKKLWRTKVRRSRRGKGSEAAPAPATPGSGYLFNHKALAKVFRARVIAESDILRCDAQGSRHVPVPRFQDRQDGPAHAAGRRLPLAAAAARAAQGPAPLAQLRLPAPQQRRRPAAAAIAARPCRAAGAPRGRHRSPPGVALFLRPADGRAAAAHASTEVRRHGDASARQRCRC